MDKDGEILAEVRGIGGSVDAMGATGEVREWGATPDLRPPRGKPKSVAIEFNANIESQGGAPSMLGKVCHCRFLDREDVVFEGEWLIRDIRLRRLPTPTAPIKFRILAESHGAIIGSGVPEEE